MDSVIVDLMSEWYRKYNLDYEDNLTIERAVSWDATEYVKKECGDKIYDYLLEPGFFQNLRPLPNAIEVINRLTKKFEIYIVTSPPSKYAYREKEEWLLKNLPIIPRKNLIFIHQKEMIQADILFDDSPVNLQEFNSAGGLAIAMDYPYNKFIKCERVASWLEFEIKMENLLLYS